MDKLEERFWNKVKKTDSCWLWIGAQAGEGYGKYQIKRKPIYAHRFSYQIHKGLIPKRLHIDHLCRNRLCVNPDHLEAVTCRENLLRGIGPTAKNSMKTHCPKGHEYNKENTYIKPNFTRRCKICHRANSLKFYYKHK